MKISKQEADLTFSNSQFLEAFRDMKYVISKIKEATCFDKYCYVPKSFDLKQNSSSTQIIIFIALIAALVCVFTLYMLEIGVSLDNFYLVGLSTYAFIWCYIAIRAIFRGYHMPKDLTFENIGFRILATLCILLLVSAIITLVLFIANRLSKNYGLFITFVASIISITILYSSFSIFSCIASLLLLFTFVFSCFFFKVELTDLFADFRSSTRVLLQNIHFILPFLFCTSLFHFLQFNLLKNAIFSCSSNKIILQILSSPSKANLVATFAFVLLLIWSYKIIRMINIVYFSRILQSNSSGDNLDVNLLDLLFKSVPYSFFSAFVDSLITLLFLIEKICQISNLLTFYFLSNLLRNLITTISAYVESHNQILFANLNENINEKSVFEKLFAINSLNVLFEHFKTISIVGLSIVYLNIDLIPKELANYSFLFYVIMMTIMELIYLFTMISSLEESKK